jgi:flagellar protein FliS
MMYDGCLKFLRLAKEGVEAGDIAKFSRFLSKAQAVIAELMNTLDFERGGQIARDLDRLYDFMLYYLTEANIQKDGTKIQRVIDLLSTVSSAYREIIESGQAERELAQLPESVKHESKSLPHSSSEPEKEEAKPQIRVSY